MGVVAGLELAKPQTRKTSYINPFQDAAVTSRLVMHPISREVINSSSSENMLDLQYVLQFGLSDIDIDIAMCFERADAITPIC